MKISLLFNSKKFRAHVLVLLATVSGVSRAQMINNSFENFSGPDLSGWKSTCTFTSVNGSAAPHIGTGNWCAKMSSASNQGCTTSWTYHKLPFSFSGQDIYTLGVWARAENTSTVGLFYGTINSGSITLRSGAITSSTVWTNLQASFKDTLAPGSDTAIVVLDAGLNSGQNQGYGYFDYLTIAVADFIGIAEIPASGILNIYPNPAHSSSPVNISYSGKLRNARLEVYNCTGKLVLDQGIDKQTTFETIGLQPGIYFIALRENESILTFSKMIIEH